MPATSGQPRLGPDQTSDGADDFGSDRSYPAAAKVWIAAGVAALPLQGKRPLVCHPGTFTRDAALKVASRFPDANLGFWCGGRNGITVVDIDDSRDCELQHVLDTCGDTPAIVRTASGKHHAYYRNCGERRSIRPDRRHAIDILGNGLCVAPPSRMPSGAEYTFLRGGLADLKALPRIRPCALTRVETPFAPTSKEKPATDVPIGKRNDTLFRSALALARAAECPADLLAQVRQANAELQSPLLDPEVQRIVSSAWRYREDGRLMVPGSVSRILVPREAINRLLTAGETDAVVLLNLLCKAHGDGRKAFAASPEAMERARLIGNWTRKRYRKGIRRLCEMGELVQIIQGGNGRHTPSIYSFPFRRLI